MSKLSLSTLHLQPLAAAALALLATLAAHAQQPAPQRVEITGSSIKRLEGESALPVQTVTREDIDKSGVTTAAELLKSISANSNGLSDGASITDGTSGQRGFNSANLRGIGTSSTLVLLNGRRLANFAAPGDAAGVDLNNIPAAAIQRVEVLKDGASAIYGTDAIGGVINFITRKDYTGGDLSLYLAGTQHGGAGKKAASISAGYGDLERQGFNLMGVLDVQKLDALRSSQRDFIAENDIPNRLGNLLSSFPVPANFDVSTAQRTALNANGNYGFTNNRINFSRPGCNPPSSVYAPAAVGGASGCTYNYMADTEIYPEAQKVGFIGRGVLQIKPDLQAFAEVLKSRATTTYRLSPVPLRLRNDTPSAAVAAGIAPELRGIDNRVPGSAVPQFAAAGSNGLIGSVRLRTKELGNRTNEVTSDATRLVLGLSGTAAGWDYDAAVNHSENQSTDRYVDGYFRFKQVVDGIKSGAISLDGNSGAAGKAIIAAARVDDEARKSKGTMDSVDVKASSTIGRLAGGELALAVGGELRREQQDYTPSALLRSNDIAGDRSRFGDSISQPTSHSRGIKALYAELVAPFTKELEGQFALRHDRYGGVGNTTNPKLGLRLQALQNLVLRGSFNTGFRAPSFSELYRPTIFGTASSILPDPVLCEIEGGDLSVCAEQWPVQRRSNAELKPEKSRQFSLGAAWEPVRDFKLTADYWNILKKDVISDIGEEIIVSNPGKYASLIIRGADSVITDILLQKRNQGRQKTSGIDLGVDWRGTRTDIGRFGAKFTGTVVLESKKQTAPDDPYVSNLNKFVNDGVVQRWRHKLAADWDRGDFGLTLANTYYGAYTDQNTAINLDTGNFIAPNKVKAYSLWDLTGSWQITKELRLRGGVLNLLDKAPPFSNQAYYFLASYDPTYTDPRGRSCYVNLQYSFK